MTLSGTVYGRQGYPIAEVLRIQRPDGLGATEVLLDRDIDRTRYDDLHLVDLRAQKTFTLARTRATVTVDAFNLLNNDVLLRQIAQVGSTFRNPTEIVPPRLVRLGLQITF